MQTVYSLPDMKYQLILAGLTSHPYRQELLQNLDVHLKGIGIDFKQYFQVLEVNQANEIDWNALPVMIWFGGEDHPTQAAIALLKQFLNEGQYIFPVVESLSQYPDLIPSELHHINGLAWEPNRVVADILKAFRLSRAQRQAFISYRRIDTHEIAIQLFSELSLHGYQVFLDVASIEPGVNFQEKLHTRLADADLLIFLDSPNATNSEWVNKELAQAGVLGLGILQLVSVGHKPQAGTEFAKRIYLAADDFVPNAERTPQILNKTMIDKILSAVETARICSLAARRTRVVGDLLDYTNELNLTSIINPDGEIQLYRGDLNDENSNSREIASLIPVVGLPNAFLIQQQEIRILTDGHKLAKSLIIYDSSGIELSYREHLNWLNIRSELCTCEANLVGDWLKAL
jgi:hypothetical protein